MAKRRSEISSEIKIGESVFPVQIISESRKNIRIALGAKHVILRLPLSLSNDMRSKYITWAQTWLSKQLERKPNLSSRYQERLYNHGDSFILNGANYPIVKYYQDRKSSTAKIKDGSLIILCPKLGEEKNDSNISRAVSRAFGQLHLDRVSKRIDFWNDLYFKENINTIRLKYNKTNWGSCSRNRNINISTRILFAPDSVQDYLFVHELSHLKEMNHSNRFWQIVSEVFPEYKVAEKWLKQHAHECYY